MFFDHNRGYSYIADAVVSEMTYYDNLYYHIMVYHKSTPFATKSIKCARISKMLLHILSRQNVIVLLYTLFLFHQHDDHTDACSLAHESVALLIKKSTK